MKPGAVEERGVHGRPDWAMPVVFYGSIPVAVISPTAATLVWLVALAILPRLFRRRLGRGEAQ